MCKIINQRVIKLNDYSAKRYIIKIMETVNNLKSMKYIVYLTTNLVNNKIYVGVHGTKNPDVFDGYIGNSINIFKCNNELKYPKIPFHKAVKKYGYNSFKRSTIQVFDTEEEARDLEAQIVTQEFIERNDTYNITLGGGMPPKHNKVVYQYDLNGKFIGEYLSLIDAAQKFNGNGNLIGIAANYKRTAYNSLWSYSKYDQLDIKEYNIYNPKIPVYMYAEDGSFIKCFTSMSDCCKELNVTLSRVQRAAKLGNKVNNYHLSLTFTPTYQKPVFNNITGDIHMYSIQGEYIKSYSNKSQLPKGFNENEINRAIKMDYTYKGYIWIRGEKLNKVNPKVNKTRTSRKIGQYSIDGKLIKIYNTLRLCRKDFPNVSKVLNGRASHCHGYTFKYIE